MTPGSVMFQPGRLWSLLEMYEFKLGFFDAVMTTIRRQESSYAQYAIRPPQVDPQSGLFGLGVALKAAEERGLINSPPPSPFVFESMRNQVTTDLQIIQHLAESLELTGSLGRIKVFRGAVGSLAPTYESFSQEWKALRQQVDLELASRLAMYIGEANEAHLASMKEAWAPAFERFPSIRPEVERGLKCFSFEQWTATVFHLMRVAEVGLRAVAKERRIRLKNDRPIDEADWGTLATRLRTQVDAVQNWAAKKPARKAALDYYSGVLADVVYFKNGYRNIVSHSLTPFERPEAHKAITRVCDFMKTVASRTDEMGKRILWK